MFDDGSDFHDHLLDDDSGHHGNDDWGVSNDNLDPFIEVHDSNTSDNTLWDAGDNTQGITDIAHINGLSPNEGDLRSLNEQLHNPNEAHDPDHHPDDNLRFLGESASCSDCSGSCWLTCSGSCTSSNDAI